jgi:hypothetical protein
MAAVLALLSTLVAAKLQLIQQWWLPTFDILDGCTCNGNNPTNSADTRARPETVVVVFLKQILNPLLIKSVGIQLTGINF